MKATILSLVFIVFGFTAYAQIGIGTTNPAATAALDIESTTKGLLFPRLTQTQRNAITNPALGLMIFCTNCAAQGEPQFYNGTSWVNMIGGAASTAQAQPPYTIGQEVLGGKVGYILQSGDPGYDANVQHGLIVATSDQSTGAQWGCKGTVMSNNPQGTNVVNGTSAIGRGNTNTQNIISECATSGIAARICGDLVQGGYSDWYLPSYQEFLKIFQNNSTWGGFSNAYYWTSTQDGNLIYPSYITDAANKAVATGGGSMGGGYGPTDKDNSYYVRAIRSY